MAILSAILVIVRWTEPILKHEPKFDGSNPYIKFDRNQVINDEGRVSTKQTDRRRPFCWLPFIGQGPYSYLNQSLMKGIYV